MEIDKIHILDLLKKTTKFEIPYFQREYTWEKENCFELMKDVFNNKFDDYFLGSLIFKKSINNDIVIDGQQRTTTCILILKSISESLNYFDQNLNDILSNFSYDSILMKDKNVLNSILNNNISSLKDYENSNIFKNYCAIKLELRKYDINQFYENMKKVCFSRVSFGQEIDGNILFSQVNSTGIKLTNFDLFKNDILSKLIKNIEQKTNDKKEQSVFINDCINKLDNLSDYLNDRDDLLRNFIAYETTIKINKAGYKIYKEYLEIINKKGVDQFFEQFIEFAIYYKFFMSKEFYKKYPIYTISFLGKENTYINLIIFIIKQFSTVHNNFDVKISNEKSLIECLKIINNYIYSRWLCNYDEKTITRYIPTLNRKIIEYKNKFNLDFVNSLYLTLIYIPLQKHKTNECELTYRAPDINEINNCFLKNDFYSGQKAKNTKNFLLFIGCLNRNLNNQDILKIFDEYTVEHIIPRNPKNDSIKGTICTDEQFNELVHRIGNLTLLHKTINSKSSNNSFDVKQYIMNNHDAFPLNQSLQKNKEFNLDTIEQRANELLDIFHKEFDFKNYENNCSKLCLDSINEKDYYNQLENAIKNKANLKQIKINYEVITNLLNEYYNSNNGQGKSEEKILGKDYDGWIVNLIRTYLGIPEKSKKKNQTNDFDYNNWLITNKQLINEMCEVFNQIVEKE